MARTIRSELIVNWTFDLVKFVWTVIKTKALPEIVWPVNLNEWRWISFGFHRNEKNIVLAPKTFHGQWLWNRKRKCQRVRWWFSRHLSEFRRLKWRSNSFSCLDSIGKSNEILTDRSLNRPLLTEQRRRSNIERVSFERN